MEKRAKKEKKQIVLYTLDDIKKMNGAQISNAMNTTTDLIALLQEQFHYLESQLELLNQREAAVVGGWVKGFFKEVNGREPANNEELKSFTDALKNAYKGQSVDVPDQKQVVTDEKETDVASGSSESVSSEGVKAEQTSKPAQVDLSSEDYAIS